MGHPDYEELLDALGATLPTECRENRVPYPGGYADAVSCSVDGILGTEALPSNLERNYTVTELRKPQKTWVR